MYANLITDQIIYKQDALVSTCKLSLSWFWSL